MKVSGFTFIRNAVQYDFPIVEAVTSVLPIVDEFIVNVGRSDDATLDVFGPSDHGKFTSLKRNGTRTCVRMEKYSGCSRTWRYRIAPVIGRYSFKVTKWCMKKIMLRYGTRWNDT